MIMVFDQKVPLGDWGEEIQEHMERAAYPLGYSRFRENDERSIGCSIHHLNDDKALVDRGRFTEAMVFDS